MNPVHLTIHCSAELTNARRNWLHLFCAFAGGAGGQFPLIRALLQIGRSGSLADREAR
jgi:hypothetical protein